MKLKVTDIRSSWEGFSQLSRLALELENCFLDEVEIDMSGVGWFDANMCAPFGAILHRTRQSINTVSITISGIQDRVQTILSKNGFLGPYGFPPMTNTYRTTIPYKLFKPTDLRYFNSYIKEYLRGKGIPDMTEALRKEFYEGIMEIFSNAATHSETKMGIHACGQFFPKDERLDFSLADLGIGIRMSILQMGDIDLTAAEAIQWAIAGRNTTRRGATPGGSGLKILREFVNKNNGRIQIVSDRGYWELNRGQEHLRSLEDPFPGTVVNLEFNTADNKSYCLASEIRPEDLP